MSLSLGQSQELPQRRGGGSPLALAAALLGFFVITLDAVVVNVALPAIRHDFGGGMTGLQWVVDGYTLMFAALLLSAGALSDRIGARQAVGAGLVGFVVASLACGLAPSLGFLVAARLVQGIGAAVMMPATLAMVREAYPDARRRARAIATWAMGGAAATAAGPVVGGFLTMVNWRSIFFINLPVGVIALLLLARVPRSDRRPAPFDWTGQVTAVLAMGGLTYGVIEAGADGFTTPRVLVALAVAVVALAVFLRIQARGRHPMLPLDMFRSRTVVMCVSIGFTFMVAYYGLPFLISLDLQQMRGLSPFATGLTFIPMLAVTALLNPPAARLIERIGRRAGVATGLGLMAAGIAAIAAIPPSTPVWVLALLMFPVGLGAPLVMPPTTALLLDSVPPDRTGTASGVLNTFRQVGGALAVAVFGTLLTGQAGFVHGLRTSLVITAVLLVATTATLLLTTANRTAKESA